jgi:hypothetical protein
MLKECYPAENSQHLASSQQLDDTQATEEPAVPDAEDLLIFGTQEVLPPAPRARTGSTGTQPWKVELQRYLAAPKAQFSADILKWWDFYELEYPHLAKVARDYAGIPGSSAPSERVFSRAGDLITKKRNRLAPETADSIMCPRYCLGMPEVTQRERTRVDNSLEDGTEAELLVDHYLPEDDNLGQGDGNMGIPTEEELDLLVDEDMGVLVDALQE